MRPLRNAFWSFEGPAALLGKISDRQFDGRLAANASQEKGKSYPRNGDSNPSSFLPCHS
jgi:hypothetical protein